MSHYKRCNQSNVIPSVPSISIQFQFNFLTFLNYSNHLAIKFYFQLQNNNILSAITTLLPRHNTTQTRVTRAVTRELIRVPTYKKNFGLKSFFRTSTIIWNEIPPHIRSATSIHNLKNTYKQFLIDNYICNH